MTTVSREEMLDRCWSTLVEMTDRTSPEEYPDMCLITREELSGFLRLAAQPADDGVREATIEECAKAVEEMDFPAPRKNHRYQYDVKYKMVEAIRALSTKAKP